MKTFFVFIIVVASLANARDIPSDSKIQGRLNIVNGASAECVMDKFYTNSGWTKVNGQIGRTGIDGLYYKKQFNVIKEVLVAESKWNKSALGKSGINKAVKQISQEWVLRSIEKLVRINPSMPYDVLKQFVKNNQYRARIFRVKPVANNKIQISIYKIQNKGFKVFTQIRERELKAIDINRPSNSFELGIVQSYNNCRRYYLKKYFSVFTDDIISVLLTDNYIQKKDIRKVLRNYY